MIDRLHRAARGLCLGEREMDAQPLLSIVVPVYDEEQSLPEFLAACRRHWPA